MTRTVSVVRMQLINRQTYVWAPLLVLAASFVFTLIIYGILINAGVAGDMYGGGAQAPLWYFGVVGIQSLTLTFPFSQAMSVTRREFYLGTLVTAVMASATLSLIYVAGGLIEEATDGLGLNGYFFYFPWIWETGPAGAAIFYFTCTMLIFVAGFLAATIYKRFGTVALTAVLVGVAALILLALFLVGQMQAWAQMFSWFGSQGALGLALWGLLLGAVLAGISYLTLRRAVP